MTLRGIVKILRKAWLLICVAIILASAAGAIYISLTPALYTATAQIFVSSANSVTSTTGSDLASGNLFTQARVQSYTAVATSPEVTGPVIKQLGLSQTPSELSKDIVASAPLNKVLISITVTNQSAIRSAQICNAVALQFSAVVEELERADDSAPTPVKLSVIQPAVTPASSSEPQVALILALAALLGLVAGVLVAFIREALDNTVKDAIDLSSVTNLPVLGVVPLDRDAVRAPIAFRNEPHGPRSESFRQLRTNLQFIDVDNPPRTIAITSALPGETKSSTAINLSAALAETGKRVCLIDADLRRPTIATVLGLVSGVGLTNVLIGEATMSEVLQNAGANLAVMASGPLPPNPSELLESRNFSDLLADVAEHVDVVVVDTTPLLPVSDAAQVATQVDACVLTVRSAKTTRDQIRHALDVLDQVGVKPVGTVLSMATRSRGGEYKYYYGDYAPPVKRVEERMVVPANSGADREL